jgi:thiamine monophosphate synthase
MTKKAQKMAMFRKFFKEQFGELPKAGVTATLLMKKLTAQQELNHLEQKLERARFIEDHYNTALIIFNAMDDE